MGLTLYDKNSDTLYKSGTYKSSSGKLTLHKNTEDEDNRVSLQKKYGEYAKQAENALATGTNVGGNENGKLSFWDTVKKTVSGGVKGWASGQSDTIRTAYEAGQKARNTQNNEYLALYQRNLDRAKNDYEISMQDGDTGGAASAKNEIEYYQRLVDSMSKVVNDKVQQKATQKTAELVDDINASANTDIEKAKQGRGKLGQIMVDAGSSMTQVLMDTAATAGMGLGAGSDIAGNQVKGLSAKMIPFASRAFGGGTTQARQNGATLGQQVAYGATSSAKEVATELMFGLALPQSKVYGGGALDDVVESGVVKFIDKLDVSDTGKSILRNVAKVGVGAVGEGLEEFVGDWIEWQLPRIYNGDVESASEVFSNALYDFAVGSASAAIGESAFMPVRAADTISEISQNKKKKQAGTSDTEQPNLSSSAMEPTNTENGGAVGEYATMQEHAKEFGNDADFFLKNKPENVSVNDYYEAYKAVDELGQAFADGDADTGFERVKSMVQGTVIDEALANSIYSRGRARATQTVSENQEVISNEGSSQGQGRINSLDGGKQDQSVAGKTSVLQDTKQRSEAASLRSSVAAAGIETQSGLSIGLSSAAESSAIRVVPQNLYTYDMKSAERKNAVSGVKTVFFVDPLAINETWTDADGNSHNTTVRGAISDDGKTIYVRADHDELTVLQINDHEEFHRLAKRDSGLVERTRKKIVEKYGEKRLAEIALYYSEKYDGADLTDDELLEEILCDAYAGIDITGTEMANSDIYGGATQFSEEAVYSAIESYDMQNAQNSARAGGEISFSRDFDKIAAVAPATIAESKKLDATDYRNVSRLIAEVNSAIDGTMKSGQLVMIGKPSDVLAKYMKSSNMLYMPQNAVKKAVLSKENGGKHGLGYGVMYEMPFQFADPLAITGNTSEHIGKGDNSIVVWTDYATEAGDSVVVPIRIDVHGNIGLYNNVNTAFDAYDSVYVADLLRSGNILYTKNNKNIDELLSQRREVPKVNRSDVLTNDSISSSGKNVNSKFSRGSQGNNLTAGQQEYFRDSKVRDDNGNLLAAEKAYNESTPIQAKLNRLVDGICDEIGVDKTENTQKSVKSIVSRMKRNAEKGKGSSPYALKDLARSHFELDSFDQIPDVLDALSKKNIPYTADAKNTPFGYKGLHILWIDNGINIELQLSTKVAWPIKMASEEIYQKWRERKVSSLSKEEMAEYQKDKQRSLKMWDQLNLPDFTIWATSSSDSTRASSPSSSSMVTSPLTSPHLPAENSDSVSSEQLSIENKRLESVKMNIDSPLSKTANSITSNAENSQEAEISTDISGDHISYSREVTHKGTLDMLNGQYGRGEVIRTYKAMQLIDGKLYPPMAAKVKDENGKYQLNNPSRLNHWQEAVEDPSNIKKFNENGVGYYTLNKGNGKSVDAAYNPYEHSSNLVLNDQFEEAYQRPNIVTVECVIPESEMTSGYKAKYAKDSTGYLDWKSGVVAGKLKDNKRKVYLSRYLMPIRILSNEEVANMYKETLGDSGISVPFNVVPPALKDALEKIGVPIDYEGSPNYKAHHGKVSFSRDIQNDMRRENEKLREQVEKLTDRKEYFKAQSQRTGHRVHPLIIQHMAEQYVRNTTLDETDITGDLQEFGDWLHSQQKKDGLYQEAKDRAVSIAERLVKNAKALINEDEYESYKSLRKELRNDAISISEVDQKDFVDWKEWKRGSGLKIRSDGTDVETKYAELQEKYGEYYFPADISHPSEMLRQISKALKMMEPKYENPNTYYMSEATEVLANQIVRDMILPTKTDRLISNLKIKAKASQQNAVDRVKTQRDLKIAKIREQEKARREKNQAAWEKRVDNLLTKQREKQQAQKENAATNSEKRVLKAKIKKSVKSLTSLLAHGSKKKNIKTGQQDFAASALAMADTLFSDMTNADVLRAGMLTATDAESARLNLYSDVLAKREEMHGKLEALYHDMSTDNTTEIEYAEREVERLNSKLHGLDAELREVFARERQRLMRSSVKSAVLELASAYKATETAKEAYIKNAYNENMYARIVALGDQLGGKTINDMTVTDLQEVADVFKMVETMIKNANKLFIGDKAADLQETGKKVMQEIDTGKKHDSRIVKLDGIKNAAFAELKPVYAFRAIGSDTLTGLYNEARRGEDVWARDMEEARNYVLKAREKTGYDSWNFNNVTRFELERGESFALTLGQIMSIYAYSRRDQAIKHMMTGGFTYGNTEKIKTKAGIEIAFTSNHAFKLTLNDLQQIVASLTPEQAEYVETMQRYLSEVCAAKGNEVSNKLYGIDLFKEMHYFPLKSSHDFLFEANTPAAQTSLANSGMTKEVTPGASNPIVLQSFDEVWSSHVNKMALYHGLAVPIDSLNRVYNYSEYMDEQSDSVSVKSLLQSRFNGEQATKYIDTFIADLNGGVRAADELNPIVGLIGKYKKTAVFASASVVVQQITAIVRGMAIIDPAYFVGQHFRLTHEQAWQQLKKYAPVAIIKEMGGFDTSSGRSGQNWLTAKTYDTAGEKAKAVFEDSGYRDDVLSKGAAFADEIGWIAIWNAVKRETRHTQNLTGEAFYQFCGERFTEIVTQTQVYDSTFSRSGLMRSKSDIVKMATAFMGEPTTTANMLFDALTQAKRGKMSRAQAGRVIATCIMANFLSSVFKSIVTAYRDDDKDKSLLEKYMKTLGGNIADDLLLINMIPFVRDIVTIFQGYDVTRSDMEIISSIKDAFDGLDSKNKSAYRKTEDFAGSIAALFGLPVKNIMRDFRSLYNFVTGIAGDGEKESINGIINAFWDGSTGELKGYSEYGYPYGIDRGTYKKFINTVKTIEGEDKDGDGKTDSGSKKANVLQFIDSLPVTSQQKDALYLQQGYSEKTISDSPWH